VFERACDAATNVIAEYVKVSAQLESIRTAAPRVSEGRPFLCLVFRRLTKPWESRPTIRDDGA
jgi:hypothetical protein